MPKTLYTSWFMAFFTFITVKDGIIQHGHTLFPFVQKERKITTVRRPIMTFIETIKAKARQDIREFYSCNLTR